MEPVPLLTLVVRGLVEYREINKQGRDFSYKWPMYFLVAASFWNFLGAGIFGFLINLPIINFYEHGTYLTMHHGHTAMFGTYGMLSIALLLFSWRGLVDKAQWKDGILKLSFWGLNGGLFLMAFVTLLPVGAIEQHGPHLPLDTDAFDADYLSRSVALACSLPRPLVLPLVPFGVSYHHDDFKGTVSISNDTLASLVYDIGMSVARNGIRKLVIINGHGGNDATLDSAFETSLDLSSAGDGRTQLSRCC